LQIDLSELSGQPLDKLFNEELGAVIQVKKSDADEIVEILGKEIGQGVYRVGRPTDTEEIVIRDNGREVFSSTRAELEQWWSDTSHQIQRLRDNSDSADQEYACITQSRRDNSGLSPKLTFRVTSAKRTNGQKPRVAILREQGVNGQVEMAAAFDRAGFSSVDVHLQDLATGRATLDDFVGLAVCGGFSYGDVLGAGEGWAKTVLFDDHLRSAFTEFFARPNTFSLGICNGCQMLATLRDLIPGADSWPKFVRNQSEQFEAREVLVRVNDSPSIFLRGMAGSTLPIVTAHGEGRAAFTDKDSEKNMVQQKLAPLQYVDSRHRITTEYPANPNGSRLGITALTTADGRATIMMPHPERVFLSRQLSWHPDGWGKDGPWMQMFYNARNWVERKNNEKK
jgi:phosphoribosylformylglycinamidine synthase